VTLPLLNSSPTVQLEVVQPDRRLRADVVPNPALTNALMVRPNGLYAKRGQRLNPFRFTRITNGTLSVGTAATPGNIDQVLSWEAALFDPSGVGQLGVTPTRWTAPASGRYFHSVNVPVTNSLGTTQVGAVMWFRKNGTDYVGGRTIIAGSNSTALQIVQASMREWIDLIAGDYLEVIWRWYFFSGIGAGATATYSNLTNWHGWRFAP